MNRIAKQYLATLALGIACPCLVGFGIFATGIIDPNNSPWLKSHFGDRREKRSPLAALASNRSYQRDRA